MNVRFLGSHSYMMQLVHRNCNTEFDEGHLKFDLAAAEAEVEASMAILTDTHPQIRLEDNRIGWISQTCWVRLKEVYLPTSLYFALDGMS